MREHDVVVNVIDNGPGVADNIRESLFEPFVSEGKQKGTGLGLSGAQKIVLAQGGNITFRTEVGKGTTFIVTMPTNGRNVEGKKTEKVA